MLPIKCPYCNDPLINEFFLFKDKNSLSKYCSKRINHKLKIFSRNGVSPELLHLSIFSNDNDKTYLWNFNKKILHINSNKLYWFEPNFDNVVSFHKSLERLSKLLIIN